MFKNVKELVQLTEERNTSISEIMITQEMEVTGKSREDIFSQMYRNLEVMEQAVENGLKGVKSLSGLTGGDAVKLQAYIASGKTLSGHTILDAVSKAVGASNAMIAADMALAGITSRIPCDEVIDAMYKIGQTMPTALRETAQGGLAATPTARELEKKIFGGVTSSRDTEIAR